MVQVQPEHMSASVDRCGPYVRPSSRLEMPVSDRAQEQSPVSYPEVSPSPAFLVFCFLDSKT